MIKLIWSYMDTYYEQVYSCEQAARGVIHEIKQIGIKYEIKEVDSKSDRHAKESTMYTA